jgi:hypothetical protein
MPLRRRDQGLDRPALLEEGDVEIADDVTWTWNEAIEEMWRQHMGTREQMVPFRFADTEIANPDNPTVGVEAHATAEVRGRRPAVDEQGDVGTAA